MAGERFEGDGSEFSGGILTTEDIDVIAGVDGVIEVYPIVNVAPLYIEHNGTGKFELAITSSTQIITPELVAGAPMPEGSNHLLLTSSYLESLGFYDAESAVGQPVTIGIADHNGETYEREATISGVQNDRLFNSGVGLNQTLTDALQEVQEIGRPADIDVGFFLATARFDPGIGDEALSALKSDLADLGYNAATAADQIGIIQAVISGIIGVLNAFAVIALLAAGFGIINTLLMSVQERTREIGLMKAMGMGGGRIYALFSVEAVFIGLLGSVIGALGAMGAGAIANVILAGTIPARRAARHNPIIALRYE